MTVTVAMLKKYCKHKQWVLEGKTRERCLYCCMRRKVKPAA